MEAYYILIVGFLFILAISLLIVGVSNDAVNFLNSAIGSKAAPYRLILVTAAAGILIGAVFSNGMMEVARKGIFNPEYFAFSEIIVVFLAVMLTNILLLDFFNTVGLPTSTTISIVFGLLGAATAVALFTITGKSDSGGSIDTYINIESSGLIIVGIFLSIVIAFSAGMIIQSIVRLAFSFKIGKSYKYLAGVWGGFAITAILYFLLIKGAKGSTLVDHELLDTIKGATGKILFISFLGWTTIFQLLVIFTRVNILKITVLVGTFALAMAFAGNDLVNFIGVPLAGFESFKAFSASGSSDAGSFMLESLREPVNTPVFFLITAGIVMVLTLRFSKKAKSVTETEIGLGRQDEGAERFASSALARFIVRRSIEFSNGIQWITPNAVTGILKRRFDAEQARTEKKDNLAFDLVRASVNLVVASILISIGTSLKLPLSTTYVTFMVAMGTSLADGAWGRDSAVYRVTGVLTVIGGWFFTAFSAFLAAFLIATLIYFGKMPVIIILFAISAYVLIWTHALHKKRSGKKENIEQEISHASYEVLKSCDEEVRNSISTVSRILQHTYSSFLKEKHKELKSLRKETKILSKEIKEIRENIPNTLKKFEETDLISGHHYVQVVTYMKEMSNSLLHIVQPAFVHLDNNHAFDREQLDNLKEFNDRVGDYFKFSITLLKNRELENMDAFALKRDEMINMANELILSRIKILKKSQKGVKVSATYMEMLSETKNLILNVSHLVKADVKLLESDKTRKDRVGDKVAD